MKRCAVLVVALLVLAGGGIPARADRAPAAPRRTGFVLKRPHAFPRSRFPSGRKVLETRAFALTVGERRLVHGRLMARSTVAKVQEQQLGLLCKLADAPDAARMVLTSRNHPGPSSAGGAGLVALDARYLFVAPATGSYRCSLWARGSGERIVALPRQTFMSISRTDEPLAQQWSGAPCASKGGRSDQPDQPLRAESACRYLVPGGRGGFAATGTALTSDRFVADPAARSIEVFGDLQLTTCYRRTKSCAKEASRFGGRSPHSRAVVATRLEAIQLDVAGAACARSTSPAGSSRKTIITSRAHHQKISHRLVHRVSTAPGCTRRFLIRVVARAVSGDPVKITEIVDDKQRRDGFLDGLPGVAMSNAIARNLF